MSAVLAVIIMWEKGPTVSHYLLWFTEINLLKKMRVSCSIPNLYCHWVFHPSCSCCATKTVTFPEKRQKPNQNEITVSAATLALCWSASSCFAGEWCNEISSETRELRLLNTLGYSCLIVFKVAKHLIVNLTCFLNSKNQIYPVPRGSDLCHTGLEVRFPALVQMLTQISFLHQLTDLTVIKILTGPGWTNTKERWPVLCVFAHVCVCITRFLVSSRPAALFCCRAVL